MKKYTTHINQEELKKLLLSNEIDNNSLSENELRNLEKAVSAYEDYTLVEKLNVDEAWTKFNTKTEPIINTVKNRKSFFLIGVYITSAIAAIGLIMLFLYPLAKIEKLFADRLQGKKSALKNAVLKGKAGGINGFEDETSIQGLGVLPAAAIAAAIPVITSALKALVDSGAMKKEEADGIEAEVQAKTTEANSSASESDMNNTASGESSASSSSGGSGSSGGSNGSGADDSGGIMGFVKKQPLVVIGGAALGIWGLTKLLGGKKKSNGMAGTPAKRNYQKRKKKTKTSKKTLKTITLK